MVNVILNSYYDDWNNVVAIVKKYRRKNIIFHSVGLIVSLGITLCGAYLFDSGMPHAKWSLLFLFPAMFFSIMLMGCYSYKGLLRLSNNDVHTLEYCLGVPDKYRTLPLSQALVGKSVEKVEYDAIRDVYKAKCVDRVSGDVGYVDLYRIDVDGDGIPDINLIDLNKCKLEHLD